MFIIERVLKNCDSALVIIDTDIDICGIVWAALQRSDPQVFIEEKDLMPPVPAGRELSGKRGKTDGSWRLVSGTACTGAGCPL